MSDIIARLRDFGGGTYAEGKGVMLEAADEIEALRAALAECVPDNIEQACDNCGGEDAECPDTCYVRKARALLAASAPSAGEQPK